LLRGLGGYFTKRGHKSIEEMYRTYRHLMPGSITKAARILDASLWEAAWFPDLREQQVLRPLVIQRGCPC
jgi:hypothetical protein